MKIHVDMRDGVPVIVYAYERGVTGDTFREDNTMVDPIAPGGPPDHTKDEKPPLRHPGFYVGDDYVEWTKNKIALLNYNSAALRDVPKLQPVQQQMLDTNNRELAMMNALAQKAGIVP